VECFVIEVNCVIFRKVDTSNACFCVFSKAVLILVLFTGLLQKKCITKLYKISSVYFALGVLHIPCSV